MPLLITTLLKCSGSTCAHWCPSSWWRSRRPPSLPIPRNGTGWVFLFNSPKVCEPKGDWFSIAKVRKLCFLCSCKQMLVFARLTCACTICIHTVSSAGKAVSCERAYDSQRKSHKTVYIILHMDFIFLQKCMDSLQEAFIHTP